MIPDLLKVWKTVKDMVANSLKPWVFVLLVSVFLKYCPEKILKNFSLAGLGFGGSSGLGLLIIISAIAVLILLTEKVAAAVRKKIVNDGFKERLRELTSDQKLVLHSYLSGNSDTQYFALEDGVVDGLVRMGVLYRATAGRLDSWAFNIQPWAKKYLQKNLDLVMNNIPLDDNGQVRRYLSGEGHGPRPLSED